MEEILNFFKNILQSKIAQSLIIIVVSCFIYRIITKFTTKSEKNKKLNQRLNNKSRTYLKLINNIIRYIFIIITVLILLQTNGIDVSSMLAGVGIASVILGLAIQDALKDIIRGFSILSENYFSVGDVVIYNNITGKVLELGLKTTKIKDIATDNIISIANRNIEQIQIVSNYLYVNFPMPYELPVDKAEKVISKIIAAIKETEFAENVEYKGVTELADSSIKYLLKITCYPENRLQARRDCLRCILKTLSKNNIEVPYNQIDIHQKWYFIKNIENYYNRREKSFFSSI